jgi:hypothetical protein
MDETNASNLPTKPKTLRLRQILAIFLNPLKSLRKREYVLFKNNEKKEECCCKGKLEKP